MRPTHALLILTFGVILFSCKKNNISDPIDPPPAQPNVPTKHVLLKDITIPHLPSPYYHFEYNADSMVTKADFDSGLTMYDIFYSDKKISEMRNNILVNHDTLRYLYDNAGKVAMIKFINDANVIYRHVIFTYSGDMIKEIEWDRKSGNSDFFIDRTVTFSFDSVGNLKTMTDHRLPFNGSPEQTLITMFEHYDEGINVDDFGLIHDGIHDHLFLLQGFRLQRNNPGKETFSVNGVNLYTVDYTYVYNTDSAPSIKKGDFVYLSGSDNGKRFETNSIYTYY
jgi:hypothetical protein